MLCAVRPWRNPVKFNVAWEAYSLLSSYRLSQALPNSEKFRQDLQEYLSTALDKEWRSMEQGSPGLHLFHYRPGHAFFRLGEMPPDAFRKVFRSMLALR